MDVMEFKKHIGFEEENKMEEKSIILDENVELTEEELKELTEINLEELENNKGDEENER